MLPELLEYESLSGQHTIIISQIGFKVLLYFKNSNKACIRLIRFLSKDIFIVWKSTISGEKNRITTCFYMENKMNEFCCTQMHKKVFKIS